MRITGAVSLATAFGLFVPGAPAAGAHMGAEERSLPMEIVGTQIVVPVKIDGKGPFRFVLDTGAGRTALDRDLARELALPVTGRVRVGDPANPEAITADEVRIDRFELAGAVFRNLTAASWEHAALDPESRTRGVLGMEIFSDGLLVLDYPGRRLIFRPGELPAADGRGVVPFRRSEGGTLVVPLTIGKVELEADLDSGSPEGVALPKKWAGRLALDGELARIGRGRTAAGEFEIYGATSAETLRIGSVEIPRPRLTFNDYLPVANIGYRLLRHFVVTLDQKNGRVRFETKGSEPIAL